MRPADEIKKGLECCHQPVCPKNCPYNKPDGICEMTDDVEIYIPQLEAQNAEQAERIQQLEAERDALMTFMQKECYYCKHNFSVHPDCPCLDCVGESHFEWRGVQKEESPC